MPEAQQDAHFMEIALKEAMKGLGRTSPNPVVGAVLVVDGKIAAKGHHREAGAPHAEIECLRSFGRPVPADATLYVTLEPCSTSGRTPQCTHAIAKAGVKNLVIGAIDLNPKHAGRGIKLLQQSGVRIRSGVLAEQCTALNETFNKWIQTGRPFVVAKCGMSLDGRLTRRPEEARWITSPAARRHAHRLRAQMDAILIGAETLRTDNPRLTVRGVADAKQPWRIVLSQSGRVPRTAELFTDRFAERTIVLRNKSLGALLGVLGQKRITSVLVEGGGETLGRFLDARLVDKVHIYVAPAITGGPVPAFGARGAASTEEGARLERVSYQKIGEDICVTGYPAYGGAKSG